MNRPNATGAARRRCHPNTEGVMSARGRYFGTVNGPLWFWDPIDDRATADKWLTHPFERREDWHPHAGPFGTIMILDKDRLQALEGCFRTVLGSAGARLPDHRSCNAQRVHRTRYAYL
jgi:hypothetical protein